MKVIDCHTHLQTDKLIKEYFCNRNYYTIAMKSPDSLIGNGEVFYETLKNCKNVFICECVDLYKDIAFQLKEIEKRLNNYNIVGIKIYLGYQEFYADDKILYPVYKFAEEKNLTIVFHCGFASENLDYDKKKVLTFSSSRRISQISKKFPNVNFVASHFDIPNYEDCINLILSHSNVYTDISGVLENINNEDDSLVIQDFINSISPVLSKFDKEKVAKKVMFGTDYFGKDTKFYAVEEYIEVIKVLFGEKNLNNCLYENCLKAYPRIKNLLN